MDAIIVATGVPIEKNGRFCDDFRCAECDGSVRDCKIFRHSAWPLRAPRLHLTELDLTHDRPTRTSLLICDLTQSWSAVGGGVGTYLRHKRGHILERTPHRHLLIVPGDSDSVIEEDERAITVTIKSPHVPGSPNYRLLLRNGAVREALEQHRPDLIECQDAYNLPVGGDRRTAGAFRTPRWSPAISPTFPTVYVERPLRKVVGSWPAGAVARLGYRYSGAPLPPLRRGVRAERERRGGQAARLRRRRCRDRAARRRARRILARSGAITSCARAWA